MSKILCYGTSPLTTTYLTSITANKCPSYGEVASKVRSSYKIASASTYESTKLLTSISIVPNYQINLVFYDAGIPNNSGDFTVFAYWR